MKPRSRIPLIISIGFALTFVSENAEAAKKKSVSAFGFDKQVGQGQQGSSKAESIELKTEPQAALDEKTIKELKVLAADEKTSPAVKKLIEQALNTPREVAYTQPAGFRNITSPSAKAKRGIPPRRAPLDLSRAQKVLKKKKKLAENAFAENQPRNEREALMERRKLREMRMPSFMRGDSTPAAKPSAPIAAAHKKKEPAAVDLLEIAGQLLRGRKFDKAHAAIRADLLIHPNSVEAHIVLIQILIQKRKFLEAVDTATIALPLAPRDGLIYFLRAVAHENLGNRKAKLSDLRMAASLDPNRYQRFILDVKKGKPIFDPDAGGIWDLVGPLGHSENLPPRRWNAPDLILIGLGAASGFVITALIFILKTRTPSPKKTQPPGTSTVRARLESWAGRIGSINEAEEIVTKLHRTPLPPMKLRRNTVLAEKYTLVRFIGYDGTVEVWKSHDKTLGRDVLIKRLYAGHKAHGAEERTRRLEEARQAAKLRHPNINDLYEILDIASGLYIVYEYVSGKTVHRILEEKGSLPVGQVRDILIPVCRALEHAHHRDIAHGGLSPERIVVAKNGYIKVSDFVLARTTGEGAERYAAPEARRGEPMPVSDIYSLGLCCYEMLTGELPHSGTEEPDEQVQVLLERTLDLDHRTRLQRPTDFLRMLHKLPDSLAEPPPQKEKEGSDDDQSGSATEATA